MAYYNAYDQHKKARYDYYNILHVDKNDSIEKIEEAYKHLTTDPHCKNVYKLLSNLKIFTSLAIWLTGEHSHKMDEIHAAGLVLLNEAKREAYDKGMFHSGRRSFNYFYEFFEHPEFYHTRPY